MEALATVTPVNTMLFAALLVLLKIVLGMRVTAYRIKNETMWGDNADIKMQRLIRAHGNHAEWMPGAMIILGLIEMAGVSPLIVFTLGAALLVGRLLHSIGLMGNAEAFNRVAGMVITIGVMAISSVIGIIEYFAPGSF